MVGRKSRGEEMSKPHRILFVSALVQLALFLPLARWARKHAHPPGDVLVSRLLQKKQSRFAYFCVLAANTLTGSAIFLNVLVVPMAALLWRRRLRWEAVMMLANAWTNTLVRVGVKYLVQRPRPHPSLVRATTQLRGKSFPSGHVASSIAVWGWLLALGLFSKQSIQPRKRLLLGLPAAFIAFTGPARVYLGDHWATDVLGGYLFGGGWLSFFLGLYLRFLSEGKALMLESLEEEQ
jgi:membrane-associated phospholipid phosphatase